MNALVAPPPPAARPNLLLDTLVDVPLFIGCKVVPRDDGSGKADKIPCDFAGNNIDAHDPANWLYAYQMLDLPPHLWVGTVLSEQAKRFCIDLDNAYDPATGQWSAFALKVLAMFPTAYREMSHSGTGLHIHGVYRGELPKHRTRRAGLPGIEIYSRLRFILQTGTAASGDYNADYTDQLLALIAECFDTSAPTVTSTDWTTEAAPGYNGPTDDDQLLEQLKSGLYASPAQRFGAKATFADVWEGTAAGRAHCGDDESALDMSLASRLAFATGKNCARVLRIMEGAPIARDKWEREDYLPRTILEAVHTTHSWPGKDKAAVAMAQLAMVPNLDVNMRALHPTVCAEILAAADDMLFLSNDHLPDNVAAQRIFKHLGGTRELFRRGDAVVELSGKSLAVMTPAMLQSRLNERGRKVRSFSVNDKTKELFHHTKRCGESHAKVFLSTRAVTLLPEVKVVARMPPLIERGGVLIVAEPGFNPDSGILVTSDARAPVVPLAEAAAALDKLLCDFQFAEPGDRARALAAMVAPVLRMSRLVQGNTLMTAVEADQSQTGKGYYLQVARAIYGETAPLIAQRKGGVGSFDESLSQALLAGSPFIAFDNLRGALSSTLLEAVLTADKDPVDVRVPHRASVPIDVRYTSLQLTSNGVQGTVDLSNRLMLVRLRKQPGDYGFTRYPEGDLLAHAEARAAYFLGCVYAVVRQWHAAGKPELHTPHSFRHSVGALDWIVQNVWQTVPLLTGHDAALGRIANPGLSWLRKVALLAMQAGEGGGGQGLTIEGLRDLCRDHDELPPGVKPDTADKFLDLALGRVLAGCFKGTQAGVLVLEGVRITVVEREERNEWRTMVPVRRYAFAPA